MNGAADGGSAYTGHAAGHRMCAAWLSGLVLSCAALPAMVEAARSGPVHIYAPGADAVLDARIRHKLEYEIEPGARGHHVHLYVDDLEVAILRQRKGNHLLPKLKPGRREICVKAVNAQHVPIGVESCIHVTVR